MSLGTEGLRSGLGLSGFALARPMEGAGCSSATQARTREVDGIPPRTHPLPHHALRWHVLPVHSTAQWDGRAGSARQRATPRSGRPPASRRPGSARLSSPHLPFAPLEISDCPLCTSQRGCEDG